MLKVQNLTDLEKSELAEMWKKYGKILRILENGILYTGIIEYVQSERDKEVIKALVSMQNDVLEGFYEERLGSLKQPA